MLVYTNSGMRDFGEDPVETKQRSTWEFWALLQGNITFQFGNGSDTITSTTPTLWAFPPMIDFGCHGTGLSERAVFDFSSAPPELAQHLGKRNYYEEPLSTQDCARIRQHAQLALQTVIRPTQLVNLRQNTILHELALIALRSIDLTPLKGHEHARQKADQAMGWFVSRMDENPQLENAAKFVHVSVAHLRRIFHEAYGESPKQAFTRLRCEKVEELLCNSNLSVDEISGRVGLSSASTLNHFVQKHFGRSPKALRTSRKRQQATGG